MFLVDRELVTLLVIINHVVNEIKFIRSRLLILKAVLKQWPLLLTIINGEQKLLLDM